MTDKQYDDNTNVEFATASLYKADGFESGDLLKKYFPYLSASDLRDVLSDVVLRHVVPQLDQPVSIMVIPSARNPVRITSVGTESVVWHTANAGAGPAVTPAVVTVDIGRIKKSIPKQAAKPPVAETELEPEAGE